MRAIRCRRVAPDDRNAVPVKVIIVSQQSIAYNTRNKIEVVIMLIIASAVARGKIGDLTITLAPSAVKVEVARAMGADGRRSAQELFIGANSTSSTIKCVTSRVDCKCGDVF